MPSTAAKATKPPPPAIDALLAKYIDLAHTRRSFTPDEIIDDLLELRTAQRREAEIEALEAMTTESA